MNKIISYKILFLYTLSCLILSGCASIKHFISPESDFNAQKTVPIERVDSSQNQYYTVQPNESLYQVAKKFNVTERALILWNNLKSPYTLKQGQVLQVFPKVTQDNKQELTGNNIEEVNNDDIYSLNDSTLSYDIIDIQEEKNISSPETRAKKPVVTENSETISEKIVIKKFNTPDRTATKGYYIVRSGDSLLGIANSFNLSLSELAQINKIEPPYPVFIGQKLLIDHSMLVTNTNKTNIHASTNIEERNESQTKPSAITKTLKTTIEPSRPEKQTQKISSQTNKNKEWQWPIPSKTEVTDSDTIALLQGYYHQAVVTACTGKVIYSGIGVEGYGKMIIVSCKNNYMTAYSNLSITDVNEGQTINAGSKIGELGKFKGESVLSFEIRKDGSPVPIKSLIQ